MKTPSMTKQSIRTQLAQSKLRLKVIYLLRYLKEVKASTSRKYRLFTLETKATSDSRQTLRTSKMARRKAVQTAPRIVMEEQMKTRL